MCEIGSYMFEFMDWWNVQEFIYQNGGEKINAEDTSRAVSKSII